MSTPTVIEIARRPEPVLHDPFIDDLSPRATPTAKPSPAPDPAVTD